MGPLHESGHISNSQSKVQTANQRWRWIVCLVAQLAVSSCAYTTDRVEACQREKGATDADVMVTCASYIAAASENLSGTPIALLNCANTVLKHERCAE